MKKLNRILSVILTVIMLVTMLPSAVFAVESDGKYEAESVEEADAASGQKTDQEASVDEAGEKGAKNEEVQNEVDSELKDDGSDEVRKAQDPAPEETGNTEEADKAESSEGKNVTSLVKEEKDYVVTVTYGDDAEVPPYAKIRVEEVKAKDDPDLYDSYVAQAAEAVKSEVEDLSYVKLLDISIVDENDKEVDLQGNVDVQIRLKDVEEAEDTTQVVHFEGEEEEPVVMKTEVEGDTVAFETEGFSVYAVVTQKTDPNYVAENQRLVVEFYKKAYGSSGNALLATMYVKKADLSDEAEFHKIIYDPGIPDETANADKDFYWVSETTASALEADAGPDPSQGLTIAGIRNEITTLLNKQGGIDDGTTIRYYPVFYKTFRLYYKDERGEVIDTVASYLAEGNECSVNITKEYIAEKEGKVFRYWVEEGKEEDPDAPKYVKDTADGYVNAITLSNEATLVPVLADGYMVTFDENDGNTPDGAGYTPSQARAFGEFPLEPATPPSWDHHDFVGWFENPQTEEGQNPYDGWAKDEEHLTVPKIENKIAPTGNITLYAHWVPKKSGTVDYKVKVWLQNVDEDGYDPAGEFMIRDGVTIGKQIDPDHLSSLLNDERVKALSKAQDLDESSHGFEYEKTKVVYDGENGTAGIPGDTNTVVNLYYVRAVMEVYLATLKDANTSIPALDLYVRQYDNGVLQYTGIKEDPEYPGGYYFYDVIGNKHKTKIYCRKSGNSWDYYYYDDDGDRKKYNPDFYRIDTTQFLTDGKYGGVIDWPYGTSNGKAPSKFIDLKGTSPKTYLTVGTVRCLRTFNGDDFEDNKAYVFEQSVDINTIVYIYDETLEDPDKYDFVGPTYLASLKFSIPINLNSWHEGFAPSEYAEVYVGNYKVGTNYTQNVNDKFIPPDGKGIELPDDLDKYTWNNNLHITEGWHTVDDTGTVIHADHEDFMYYLLVKNKRIEKNLAFKYKDDTTGKWVDFTPEDTNDNIPVKYGYNLSTYLDKIQISESKLKDEIEEKVYGKVFRGWYLDPDFNVPANNADKLSEVTVGSGEIPLYAKMVTGKYHVRVFWNDDDNTVKDFRVENEDLLDLKNAKSFKTNRDGYTLVGYYKEYDAATGKYKGKWDFSTPVRADNISFPYSDSEDTARNTYYDNEEPYKHNTRGVLTLYANWYDENGGFEVEYVKPDGTPLFEDPHRYKINTPISVLDMPANYEWDGDNRFDGWILKKNNNKVYVSGEKFDALSDFVTRTYYLPENGINRSISVITLTASYVPGKKTPTHIKWFNNYVKYGESVGTVFEELKGMDINQAVTIPGVGADGKVGSRPSRPGYKFLGWAKAAENNNTGLLENAASKLLITYDEDENSYNYTKVAADENIDNGYDAFYAVWQRSTFNVYHSDGTVEKVPMPLDSKAESIETFDITQLVKENCLYGGGYLYDPESEDDKIVAPLPEPGTDLKVVEDENYYLRDVNNNYLKPQLFLVFNDKTRVINKMYALVNLDSAKTEKEDCIYLDYGLRIGFAGGTTVDLPLESGLTDKIKVLKNKIKVDELGRSNFGKPFSDESYALYFGYRDISSYVAQDKVVDIKAYYVTEDNVLVTGANTRKIKFANEDPVKYVDWTQTKTGLTTDPGSTTENAEKMNSDGSTSGGNEENNTQGTGKSNMMFAPNRKLIVTYTVTKHNVPEDWNGKTQEVEPGDNTGRIEYPEKDNYLFTGWFEDEALTRPADFSNVEENMEVYAGYIPRKDVTLSMARKTGKTGNVTFTATVTVKNINSFTEVGVSCGHKGVETGAALTKKTYVSTGTGKNYKFSGPAEVKGLVSTDSFTASVYWVTKDGTRVTEEPRTCTYKSGTVKVQY